MTTVLPFNCSFTPVETGLELSTARPASALAAVDGVTLGEGDASGEGEALENATGCAANMRDGGCVAEIFDASPVPLSSSPVICWYTINKTAPIRTLATAKPATIFHASDPLVLR